MRFVPKGLAATFDPCLRQASPKARAPIETPLASRKMNSIRIALCSLACIAFSAPAAALDFTINFDNIPPAGTPAEGPGSAFGSDILGYYNGDPGAAPTFPRAGNQLWDVVFVPDALAIASASAGGAGQFDFAHSGSSAAGSLQVDGVSFELTPGLYIAGMSFWYNAGGPGSDPAVQLYAGGLNVFSQALTLCANTGGDGFCGWVEYQVSDQVLQDFASNGQAITKVVLGSAANGTVFDDVFLSTAAIPEPSTYALMLGGLALVAGIARRRRTR